MNGNLILEIVICLAFIFLLYSLLATIVVEIIAGVFRLRARNLRHAVRRMLQDNTSVEVGFRQRFLLWLFPKRNEKKFVQTFFGHPHIKYLGKSKYYSTPSYLEPTDFSKVIVEILARSKGNSELDSIENTLKYSPDFDKKNKVNSDEWQKLKEDFESSHNPEEFLENWMSQFNARETQADVLFDASDLDQLRHKVSSENDKQKILDSWKKGLKPDLDLDSETRFQLAILYKNAGGDLNQFRMQIESWFNSTMDRSKGWYKQWVSKINFAVGFGIAVFFNLNTIEIVNDLQSNTAKRESILLQAEGTQGKELADLKAELKSTNAALNATLGGSGSRDIRKEPMLLVGWFMTALAISFGAPFWFDLLNKFMKLRTSIGVSKAEIPNSTNVVETQKSKDLYNDSKG